MPANEETEIPPSQRPEHLSWDTEQVEEYISDNAYTCDECSDARLVTRVSRPDYANDDEHRWYSLRLRHGAGRDGDIIFHGDMLEMLDRISFTHHRNVEFENLGSHYDWLCDGCYESLCERDNECDSTESSYVHSYGYRPSPIFFAVVNDSVQPSRILTPAGLLGKHSPANEGHRIQRPALGFELEMSNEDDQFSYGNCAEYLHNRCSDFSYMKEDGSVSNGFELVTHPHTIDAYEMRQELWDSLNVIRAKGWRSWKSDSSCGLHIHINRASFETVIHGMLFLKFIYENRVPLVRFAGRDSSYARFSYNEFVQEHIYDGHDINGMVIYRKANVGDVVKKKLTNDNRYLAVNAQNNNTFELRFFRGSLNPNTVRACLQFTFALHEYTRKLTSHDAVALRALEWRSFLSFIKRSSADENFQYRHLYDRLRVAGRNMDSQFITSENDD